MWKQVAFVVAVALLVGGAAQGARKAAPSNTSPPTISGTAREGETLSASSGSWSGSTPMTFSYRWQRCNSGGGSCENIRGANEQTYKLAHQDVGTHVARLGDRLQLERLGERGLARRRRRRARARSRRTRLRRRSPARPRTARRSPPPTAAGRTARPRSPTSGAAADTSGADCRDVGGNRPTYGLDQRRRRLDDPRRRQGEERLRREHRHLGADGRRRPARAAACQHGAAGDLGPRARRADAERRASALGRTVRPASRTAGCAATASATTAAPRSARRRRSG